MSALNVGQYSVIISIDGYTIVSGVAFKSLQIIESLSEPIPTCKLVFGADDTFLSTLPLTDGSLIEINIQDTLSNYRENLRFRLYSLEIRPDAYFVEYIVVGVADVYTLFQSGEPYALNNYSSEIFLNIAKELKLDYDIDTTNDSQIWVPSAFNMARWLSNIAMYGYIDETSCMIWALNRCRKLYYKDLSQIIKSANKENLPNFVPSSTDIVNEKRAIPYQLAIPVFTSGVENIGYKGYGGTDNYFNFSDYSQKEFDATKVVASSNMLNINKELSKGLENVQHPFNVGNFHEHYYDAYMQNKRQLSTYSTYMSISSMVWDPSINLYDPVQINYSPSGTRDINFKTLNGMYIINKIILTINNGMISASYQAMGQGYNTKDSTQTY